MDDVLIKKIKQLPAFPENGYKLLAMLRNEQVSMHAFAHELTHEPGISANVLRLANSSFFGMPRKITRLQEACILVGKNTLYQLVMSVISLQQLKVLQGKQCLPLWQHAIATACAAKVLSQHIRYDGELAYVCGLLHDLGQFALASIMDVSYSQLIERSITESIPIEQIEREFIGQDHEFLGALLAKHWQLPEEIEIAISHHHHHSLKFDQKISLLIYVADCVANALVSGQPDDLQDRLDLSVLSALQLDFEQVRALCEPINRATQEHLKLLEEKI